MKFDLYLNKLRQTKHPKLERIFLSLEETMCASFFVTTKNVRKQIVSYRDQNNILTKFELGTSLPSDSSPTVPQICSIPLTPENICLLDFYSLVKLNNVYKNFELYANLSADPT